MNEEGRDMKLWDYEMGMLVEVSEGQYDFMQALMKAQGNVKDALKAYPVTEEQLATWQKDAIFWPVVEGWCKMFAKSRGLIPEFIKGRLLEGIHKDNLTKSQLAAINTATRALGMGNTGTKTTLKAEITEANTTIEFNEGLIGGESTDQH